MVHDGPLPTRQCLVDDLYRCLREQQYEFCRTRNQQETVRMLDGDLSPSLDNSMTIGGLHSIETGAVLMP